MAGSRERLPGSLPTSSPKTTHQPCLVLSSEDHEHFVEHGYVVVHNAVPPETIAAAVGALEDDGSDPDHRREAVAACFTETMLDAIGELFGTAYPFQRRPAGYDMPRPYEPDASWPLPSAHVDDCYPTLMPNGWALGSFVFLTSVRSRGGAFICFPGSHRRYRMVMSRGWQGIKEVVPELEHAGPGQEFLADPGDVLLFHHILGHTGSNNTVDPATRHALLSRWLPNRRIVPGAKPFDCMSTIEKVNSARYLAHRFHIDLPVHSSPPTERAARTLADGVAPWDDVIGMALLHFGCGGHLFYNETSAPGLVQRLVSEDLIDWRRTEPIDLRIGPIRALQFHQYGSMAILGASTAAAPPRMVLYASTDMDQWTELAAIDGCSTGTPWYIYPKYPSAVAGGQAVYFVPSGHPSRVLCSWGEDWSGASEWKPRSVAVDASAGHEIQDVTVDIHHGDSGCTIVVDATRGRSGAVESEPYYAQPKDIAMADGPLRPLDHSCATAPCQIRIFNRAQGYWMVTYLRRHQGQKRLFWGYIDWEEEAPALRQLATVEAFENAKAIVGMI